MKTKNFNYQVAAREAIRAFDAHRKSDSVKEIAKTDEFRTLKAYESGAKENNIYYVLFGLEFCDYTGDNYREILIAVYHHPKEGGLVTSDVRLYTITSVK